MDQPKARFPLIVVKRPFYDLFEAGTKTVERRLHRPPWTARVFYPGRVVRIAFNYDLRRYGSLLARVIAFDVAPARDHPELVAIYPAMLPDDEIALIELVMTADQTPKM